MKFIQTNRNLEYKNEIIEIINARKKEIFDFFINGNNKCPHI